MKKNIIYSLLAVLLTLSMYGCDGFLDENPRDQLSDDVAAESPILTYLTTVANLYGQIGGSGGGSGLGGTDRGIYDLNTFTADEAILPTRGGDWYDGGLWQNLFTHNWGTHNDLVKSSWDYLYKVIGMTNQSLDKIELSLASQPDNTEFLSYKAEVRAIRALYYYYLLDLFARVPIVVSSETSIADVKQSERSEVFDFVKRELEEAIPFLSSARSNFIGEYYGRVTQPVAYFLMAKLALNAEVYTDNNWVDEDRPNGKNIKFTVDGVEKNAWEATIAYCDKITEAGYELEPNFATNFIVKNETSQENIFVIPMDPALYSSRMMYLIRSRHYEHGKAYNQGGWNGASATKEALAVFGYGTPSLDPRFALTYYSGTVEGPNGLIKDADKDLVYVPEAIQLDLSNTTFEKTAGARMKKYEVDMSALSEGQLQNNDYVLFRYADVVLMKCEALVRNGQNGNTELSLIRNRVGAPNDRLATLDNILKERLLEFAWEGLRRQDLIRFGQFNKSIGDRPATDVHLTVFPLHDDVLSLNKNLTQNYGY
jgi:hypothetical protein